MSITGIGFKPMNTAALKGANNTNNVHNTTNLRQKTDSINFGRKVIDNKTNSDYNIEPFDFMDDLFIKNSNIGNVKTDKETITIVNSTAKDLESFDKGKIQANNATLNSIKTSGDIRLLKEVTANKVEGPANKLTIGENNNISKLIVKSSEFKPFKNNNNSNGDIFIITNNKGQVNNVGGNSTINASQTIITKNDKIIKSKSIIKGGGSSGSEQITELTVGAKTKIKHLKFEGDGILKVILKKGAKILDQTKTLNPGNILIKIAK